MTSDKFWKSFWLGSCTLLLLCIALSGSLFFVHIGNIDAAAVGVTYNEKLQPFSIQLRKGANAVVDGSIYKDALPLGLSQWSWDASVLWRSGEQVYEGVGAVKASFTKEWGGFGMSGFSVNSSVNNSLIFAVLPQAGVGELYIEIYDKKGTSLGRQPVGWYAPEGKLLEGQWQLVEIPLQHLLGSSTGTISALSINTTHPGTAYFDAIQFSKKVVEHAVWSKPVEYIEPPFNPFATSTPQSLPYVLTLGPEPDARWFTAHGFFEMSYALLRISPIKDVTNDALAYFRSGRAWRDYQVQTKVDAGAQVFSILVRMVDENNYVSCAFSYSGNTVQMYSVKDGISTMVDQTEKLHYRDYVGGTLLAGVIVHGNTVICAEDGRQVLTKEIENISPTGTVGLAAWDLTTTATAHQVHAFRVDPLVGE